jgi:DNA-directed RNA polymerase specialized sigma24 family protein
MQSPGIRRKTSYLGSSIVERTKRDAIRWAIRQYRIGAREDTDILIDETVESRSRESCFEPDILLHSLLDKSEKNGLLSAAERKLLIAYEIEGLSGEELGRREGLAPKALSQRVRRVLVRLNQAFKKSNERTKGRPKPSPE